MRGKDTTGVRLGKLRRQGARLVHLVKKYFYLALPSFMLYYISKLDWWTFSKSISTSVMFHTFLRLRPLPLCSVCHTLLYFKTRLVHCVKKCIFFTLPSFLLYKTRLCTEYLGTDSGCRCIWCIPGCYLQVSSAELRKWPSFSEITTPRR